MEPLIERTPHAADSPDDGYLRPYRRQAISSYAALIIAILLQLAVPLLVRQIINSAIAAGDRRFLTIAAIGYRRRHARAIDLHVYALLLVAVSGRAGRLRHPQRDVSASGKPLVLVLRYRADRATALAGDRGCQQYPALLHVRPADGGAIGPAAARRDRSSCCGSTGNWRCSPSRRCRSCSG